MQYYQGRYLYDSLLYAIKRKGKGQGQANLLMSLSRFMVRGLFHDPL